jgi:WD40 repeat protein
MTISHRLWHAEYLHAPSSKTSRERPTRKPERAEKILFGGRNQAVTTLSFSRTDSNLLASGGSHGEINMWNVKEQACIHSIPGMGFFKSLFFAGGTDSACIAAAGDGSVIRLWRADLSSEFASEAICRSRRKHLPCIIFSLWVLSVGSNPR